MAHVIRTFKRPTKDLISKFSKLGTSTVHEALDKKGAMDPSIKPLFSGLKICGPALTVSCYPGDNLMLHKAISIAEFGDIVVATVGNHLDCGYWGEIASLAALIRGINGLVIDGSVRDVQPIRSLGFPIFCKGICMKGTYKQILGSVNLPIVCGGVHVNAGDIVLGDDDGVVVVPLENAEEIYQKSIKKEENEKAILEQLKKGKTTLELFGFDNKLKELGLIEE